MATSRNTELGYRTSVIGTVKPINDCNRIFVYNDGIFNSNSAYSEPNIYNLGEVYTFIRSNNEIGEVLTKSDGAFTYRHDETTHTGFNVIIYLSNSNGQPIGFTKFVRVQGKDRDIKLKISLQTTLEYGTEIIVESSLKELRISDKLTDETGDNLWNFTSSNTIKEDAKDIIPISRYTSHLTAFGGEDNTRTDYLINSLVRQKNDIVEFSKLDITRNIEADPYERGFTKYQFGYFGDDLAFYTWKSEKVGSEWVGEYCIISLTARNLFNRPIYYTPSDTASLPFRFGDADIDYFAGKYIVLTNGDVYGIRDSEHLDEDDYIVARNSIIDPFDRRSQIYKKPNRNEERITSIWSMYTDYPEFANIYMKPSTLLSFYGNYLFIRKIGPWFVFKYGYSDKDSFILLNSFCSFRLTEEEYNNLIIVNDKVLLINYPDYNYYLLYQLDQGEYYTEKAKEQEFNNSSVYDSDLGVYICSTRDLHLDSVYKNYYKTEKIVKISKEIPVHETILNRFRRNYYNTGETVIPNIIGCCGGILFYLTNNKKYLEYI